METPTLLVLAAGMGSRYGGLKQMDPVGPTGEAVLDYSVYDALRAGFGKVVFVIRRDMADAFRDVVGSRFEDRVTVQYVYQELDALPDGFVAPVERVKPWGTAHAILVADDAVHEPFAVINADDFYGADAFATLSHSLQHHVAADRYSMVGFRLANTLSENGSVSRGVCTVDADGMLVEVNEMTRIGRTGDGIVNDSGDGSTVLLTGEEPVSMNMWGFAPSFFDHLRGQFAAFLPSAMQNLKSEFYIADAVTRALADGDATLKVLGTTSQWFGVTYQEDRPTVVASIAALVESGAYPASLWK